MSGEAATLAGPDAFAATFASAWTARDAAALARLAAEDADMLTLSGLWCEGRAAIESALAAEFAGTFAKARLVTGRTRLRPLGPGAAVLAQRFVLSGLVDAQDRNLGHLGAVLTAVLVARADGWQAMSLQFSGLSS
jgi:uncharacterized protein (TIGR02246 family)